MLNTSLPAISGLNLGLGVLSFDSSFSGSAVFYGSCVQFSCYLWVCYASSIMFICG